MKIKRPSKKKNEPQHPEPVQQLEEHCNQAWNFLRKNPGKRFLGIASRPWILMLGTDHAGKSTLLGNASLSLSSPDKASSDSVAPTQLVDWWANKEVVFIDPSSELERTHWQPLLKIIENYRVSRPINHALLVIDLSHLMKLSEDSIQQLSAQLQATQQLTKSLPVSIVISQCDKLNGFSAAFDDFNKEQREQIFGFSFSKQDRKSGLLPALTKSFSTLLGQLNQRLIHRLHREQSLEKRRRIYQFPFELSTLIKPLETLITALPFNNTLPLHGIYFTGLDHHRPFFMNGMLKSIVRKAKERLPSSSKYSDQRLIALPIAAGIIFVLTLLWHTGYNQTVQIINQTQSIIEKAPSQFPKSLAWLSQLNTLENIVETVHQKRLLHYRWIGLPQAHIIQKTANEKYQQLLITQFIPYIKSTLLNQIQLGMKKDELALFDALKAYLSVTEKKHYNKDIITNWYRTYWKAIYPSNLALQDQLQRHLFMLIKMGKPLWKPNDQLVKEARHNLKTLNLSKLAFLELQGEYEATNVSIFPNGHIDGVSLKNATVPTFFSTENFKEIFKKKIPNIAKIIAKGNWVLGTTTGTKITAQQQIKVEKKVREMYLDYYTNVWAATLPNIRLAPADNYTTVLKLIDDITNEKSSLRQLLELVIGNASLVSNTTTKNLTAVKGFLNKKGQYPNIIKSLNDLKTWIQTLQKSKKPNKDSFEFATTRFKTNGAGDPISQAFALAKSNPDPIHSWLNTIALSTWKITLNQSRTYLNTIWHSIVLPVYNNEIKDHYPIFKDSAKNIKMKNFNNFFGSNGTVGAFFIYYLQPFVNTTKNYWTWKSLNGANLGISQKILNTFIRASIIQQMFFTDNKNVASFKFVLASLNLSDNTKEFTLNMGGQLYNLTPQKKRTVKQFFWPSPDSTDVSVQFTTSNNKKSAATFKGPWAWFRMLDANTFQTTADPEQFTLSVHLDTHSANFRVVAEHRINPMVPGIIGRYRCPDKL